MCLLYKIYRRVYHLMNKYLNCFIATLNTRASAALGELSLVIPSCRANQFSRSFLSAAVCLRNLLPSSVFSNGSLRSFKRAINLCLLKAWLYLFSLFSLLFFLLFYNLLGIMVLEPFWFIEVSCFLVLCAR